VILTHRRIRERLIAIRSRVKLALRLLIHSRAIRPFARDTIVCSPLRHGADQTAVLDDPSGHAQKKPMSILGD
jgi:hypothetical protein